MKFRTIQTTILTACLCACMTAFSGCSKGANEPYEMPSGDSLTESSDDSSSESSEVSGDVTPSESESSESQASSHEEYRREILLDHEYLESLEEDTLLVSIYLYMDEEALRAEFEAKYPELIGKDGVYYYYWPKYLNAYGEQIIRQFLSDYGIAYEDIRSTLEIMGRIADTFDKETLSLMLDDPRVSSIIYSTDPYGGFYE